MPPIARKTDTVFCAADVHLVPNIPGVGVPTPFPVTGPITGGSAKLFSMDLPIARQNDTGSHAACPGPNNFKITGGSALSFDTTEGTDKPLARVGDSTVHCESAVDHIPPSQGAILTGAFIHFDS